MVTVHAAVERDLRSLPADLARSSLAAAALALASELDDSSTSATAKASCAKSLLEIVNRLRELAPPEATNDVIDSITRKRTDRRSAT